MPSISDTVTETIQWVFPEHAGAPGQIHGGRMMQWITQAGTMAAARVAKGTVLLGAMDDIDFLHPVKVGAIAILRALYPDVEVGVVARFGAQADLARKLGVHRVFAHEPAVALIEEAAAWSGGVLCGSEGLPMAYPGGIDVVYDTVGRPETFEVGVRVLKARGTLVKAGVHGPARWEWTPLYFKEISWVGSNAFGFETVHGVRQHGIQHYLDLVRDGRVDLDGMLTHTFPLEQWREAFAALATQEESGAVKVAFDFRSN